ncbi:B12-binding domain-containing radical SAM protein [Caldimonas brevitalea]|uniref:Radical SAM domain protein n=1 Tax=Caldimonas brevitalea TaxID=413882 RepID=A0A0G3BZC9_9BURK|nr:radical SAM protein [Caldimonas brevitalea]AKJ31875.1 radical SAM domain protein [Caldimonas brevitalea]
MRILIVNPAFTRDLGHGLERYMLGAGMRFPWSLLKRHDERPRYAMFPLFMAYAAALLEKENFDVRVIDAVPLNVREDELIERVRESQPDVLLFEPNAAIVDDTLRLLVKLRAVTPAKIVLAGTHATATVRDLLAHHEVVDFVVLGEYEQAFLQLMKCLREGQPVSGLKGIAWRDERGGLTIGDRAPLIEPLDDLPFPARHLFPAYFDTDMSVYRDGFCQHSPSYHMHTSRGCPFQCNFCDRIQVLFASNKQRYFSAARVVDEMEAVKRAGAKEIYFDDDNFTTNKAHVLALCDEIVRRKVGIPWSAMCDAIALTPEVLKKMAQAGCIGIKFGLDSADAQVLHAIKKPLKLVNLEKVVATARDLGLKTHMSVVLGLSGETKETLQRTFDYSCKIDIDSVQFSLATPLPGTTLYSMLQSQGGLTAKSWSEFDGANTTVIRYDNISREYLEAFMAASHTDWLRAKFKDPRWVLRQFRFLARTAASQGLPGLWQRFLRAVQLLRGDAKEVRVAGELKTMRF